MVNKSLFVSFLFRPQTPVLFSRKWQCRFCSKVNSAKDVFDNPTDSPSSVGDQVDRLKGREDLDVKTKRLDIAIVGHPNAGKSTLVNYLCEKNVMPVSSKVHTTRCSMQGYLTEGDTQLIFWDTPGLVTRQQARRHKLPQSIFDDPRYAFIHCDVIALMVDCVDWKNTNKIPAVVKQQLVQLFSTPSFLPDKKVILLLNKIDVFEGNKRELNEIIQVLTGGYVGGKRISSRVKPENTGRGLLAADLSPSVSNWSIRERRAEEDVPQNTAQNDDDKTNLEDSLTANPLVQPSAFGDQPTMIDKLDRNMDEYFARLRNLKDSRGFNGFSAVFPLSALVGFGTKELKQFFLNHAKPGKFEVEAGVCTDASAEKVIENAIMSRVFEVLPQHLPYNVGLEIQEILQGTEQLIVVAVLHTPYQMGAVLGRNANTLKEIVSDSRDLISDIIQQPVKVSITVEDRSMKVLTKRSR